MKLEDYLKAIKECPNDDLFGEFGVFSYFSILLKADFDGVHKYFSECGLFDVGSIRNPHNHFRVIPYYRYVPGTVTMIISNDKGDLKNNYESICKDDYTVNLTLYARQPDLNKKLPFERAVANVIGDIGKFLIEENIPACMPHSVSGKYQDTPEAESRVVIHAPQGMIKSEYLRIKS